MEYKCDICGAPATVHITKIVNGQKIKMHLCQACAQKNADLYSSGFPAEIFPQIKKLEEKILDMAASLPKPSKETEASCPKCGTTFQEFEKRGRFSCPECYKAFEKRVLEIMAQLHGAIKHAGKTPKSLSKHNACKEDSNQTELPFANSESGETPKESGADFDFEKFASETFAEIMASKESLETPKQEPEEKEDSIISLKKELDCAIKDERYEDAAKIRDKINALEKK
ncbi:MAG: UvrB/UvrC motif-containing protein [Opitutales bacterium]|nr:UvrB/UvrC motif-containing protein [Opitutales bacterium]